jgi:NAD(P)-dependent dehydrogenase (short-subunit alcohol dehydrogenase family)
MTPSKLQDPAPGDPKSQGHVAISYLPEEEPDARETARWIEHAGRTALRLPGDIEDQRHCTAMIDFEQFGRLDVLVNNAAYQRTYDSIEDVPTQEFDRTFRINVYAMFWLCRAALPRMNAAVSGAGRRCIPAHHA